MIFSSSSRDFWYEASSSALTYYIEVDGNAVYFGKAVSTTGNARINIGRRVSDYLETGMPDFREYDGVVVPHPSQMRVFNLRDEDGDILESYTVLLESDGSWTGMYGPLTEPINGHADMRQKLLFSFISSSGETFNISSSDCTLGFYPSYLQLTGVSRCHTENIIEYYSDYTDLTATVDVDWIEIKTVSDSSITFDTWYIPYTTEEAYRNGVWGTISIFRDGVYKVAEYRIKKYTLGSVSDATITMSYAGGSGSTPSLWLCDGEVSISCNQEWVTPVYRKTGSTAFIDYQVDRNYGDDDRAAVISVYLSDGTLVQTITILQTLEASVEGDIDFVQDRFKTTDILGHTVLICGGVPIGDRKYAFFGIPQSGYTAKVAYFSTVPVFDAVVRKDGVVIGTERIFPTMQRVWPDYGFGQFTTGLCDYYEFQIEPNTGSTKIEYDVSFNNLSGKTLGVIYYVQPPYVPSQYEARDILSGSSGFEFYRTNTNTKNTYDDGADNGTYYATDADAQAAGYPIYGGYPASAVTDLGGAAPSSEDWRKVEVMTYAQTTASALTFNQYSFAGSELTCVSGLSASDVPYFVTWDGNINTYNGYNTHFPGTIKYLSYDIEFMDIPRVLTIDNVTDQSSGFIPGLRDRNIEEINAYSLTYIGWEMIRRTSGVTELYLPNIGCIEENNFYDMPDLTDVYLGNALRFFGCRFDSASSFSQALPPGVTFHYLGTVQEFKDKVIFAPDGKYHCSDGDLTIFFEHPCSDYYK